MNLDEVIRKVPNFPKPGILFYDITSLFLNPTAFQYVIDKMDELYKSEQIDGIIAVESRGFLIGAPFALKRNIPLVLARKKGKLPGATISESYDLEYGSATLELHASDVPAGKRWLIVDDLVATGGTLKAVCAMVERQKSCVAGVFGIIGLPFLGGAQKLGVYNPRTLIDYHGE